MLIHHNQILSTLHRITGFIVISDLIYAIYNIFVHTPKYFIGSILGLLQQSLHSSYALEVLRLELQAAVSVQL